MADDIPSDEVPPIGWYRPTPEERTWLYSDGDRFTSTATWTATGWQFGPAPDMGQRADHLTPDPPGLGSGRGCGVSLGATAAIIALVTAAVGVTLWALALTFGWWPFLPDAREVRSDVRSGLVRSGVDCIEWRDFDDPGLFNAPGSYARGECQLGPTLVSGFKVSDGAVLEVTAYSESTNRYLSRDGNEPSCPWVEGEHFVVTTYPTPRDETRAEAERALQALSKALKDSMDAKLHPCR